MIPWLEWGDEAFARARESEKPILLSISAVWCHWCHVMDRTTYSDERVRALIEEQYVPVRVDNDRRPDINARYNQGGWPTTAFLTPAGSLLAGATYLPPEQMQAALAQIAGFYRTNRSAIEERSQQIRTQAGAKGNTIAEIDDSIPSTVYRSIEAQFDEEFAGFGTAPKFPVTDVLEFLLTEFRARSDARAYDMLARTMLAMGGGGMYDPVEGGFFRYSTTRDWSVPHFEKMAEDHAALLRILAELSRLTRNPQFHTTLVSALRYVRTVLRDPRSALFAGSQDADEAYYALPLDERRAGTAPYVDRTSYSNWSAALGASLIAAGTVLEDDRCVEEGSAALDALHDRMRDNNGLLFHYAEPGNAPHVRGLLTDQAAYLRALIDAHEYTGGPRFYDRAVALAEAIDGAFFCEPGGYVDRTPDDDLGNLALPERPLQDNAAVADSFLRLHALGAPGHYRERALLTLRLFAGRYERMGMFGASYARAVRRALAPATSVKITGATDDTGGLREAARGLPDAFIAIRSETVGKTAALLCRGTVCAAPATDPAQVRERFDSIAGAQEHIPIPHAVQTGNA